jgi:hypothetical protein
VRQVPCPLGNAERHVSRPLEHVVTGSVLIVHDDKDANACMNINIYLCIFTFIYVYIYTYENIFTGSALTVDEDEDAVDSLFFVVFGFFFVSFTSLPFIVIKRAL